MAQLVKNLPAMQETWVQSLCWEDPLEKGKSLLTPVFWLGEFHGLYIHEVTECWTRLSDIHSLFMDGLMLLLGGV